MRLRRVIALLAHDLVTSIFGRQFSAAATGLQILIWILPLVTCRVVFRNALLSHGFQKDLLWCTFLATALNAGLNLILIPPYTYLGSAVAMVISEGLLLFLLPRRSDETLSGCRWLDISRSPQWRVFP